MQVGIGNGPALVRSFSIDLDVRGRVGLEARGRCDEVHVDPLGPDLVELDRPTRCASTARLLAGPALARALRRAFDRARRRRRDRILVVVTSVLAVELAAPPAADPFD